MCGKQYVCKDDKNPRWEEGTEHYLGKCNVDALVATGVMMGCKDVQSYATLEKTKACYIMTRFVRGVKPIGAVDTMPGIFLHKNKRPESVTRVGACMEHRDYGILFFLQTVNCPREPDKRGIGWDKQVHNGTVWMMTSHKERGKGRVTAKPRHVFRNGRVDVISDACAVVTDVVAFDHWIQSGLFRTVVKVG